jgi:hypothetical protein
VLRLQGDLQRIFTWHNIWRIAGSAGTGLTGGEDLGLKFEVIRVGPDGTEQGALANGSALAPGQELKMRLRNDGANDFGVTLLFLGADGEIVPKSFGMRSGAKPVEIEATVNDKSIGKEGLVVLATPLPGGKAAPDFSFLAQGPLATGTRALPELTRSPETPFAAVLRTAALGKGERSLDFRAPTNPAVLSASWVTVAPAAKAK